MSRSRGGADHKAAADEDWPDAPLPTLNELYLPFHALTADPDTLKSFGKKSARIGFACER
jgi:hypothetical protein